MGIAQADWLVVSIYSGILVAIIIAIDGTLSLLKSKRVKHDEAMKSEIRRVILGVLKTLSESTDINIVYLGASVFTYKKTRKGFTLLPLERYRLDDYPPRSNIKWDKEKGAIGVAAATRKTVHCDWVDLSRALNNKDESAAGVITSLDSDKRFGFNDDELLEMAGKYYECLATPILSVDGTKLLGILAIDIPNREGVNIEQAQLGGRDKEEVLAVPAAALIAFRMDPSYNSN